MDINTEVSEKEITQISTIAKNIYANLRMKHQNILTEEDLVSIGYIGLLDARSKFDETKGAQFKTYAYIRIRGSMIDAIRVNGYDKRVRYRNSNPNRKLVLVNSISAESPNKNHEEYAHSLDFSSQYNPGYIHKEFDKVDSEIFLEDLNKNIDDSDIIDDVDKQILKKTINEDKSQASIGRELNIHESTICLRKQKNIRRFFLESYKSLMEAYGYT